MNWPEGIEARPIDKGDVEPLAALTAAKEKVDQEGENFSAEDLAEQLDRPNLDLAYRGRGLARATIAKVLAEAVQAGYQRAALGVDADNPTGALGLYENLGFTTHAKFINYQLPIPSDV